MHCIITAPYQVWNFLKIHLDIHDLKYRFTDQNLIWPTIAHEIAQHWENKYTINISNILNIISEKEAKKGRALSANARLYHFKLIALLSSRCYVMEPLSALLPLCEGSPAVNSGFPSQRANGVKLWRFIAVQV